MQKGRPYGLERVETLSQVQKQVQEGGTGRIRKERKDQQQRLMERKGPTGECEEKKKKKYQEKNKTIKEGVIKKDHVYQEGDTERMNRKQTGEIQGK